MNDEDSPFVSQDTCPLDQIEMLVLDVIGKMGAVGGTVEELVWALVPHDPTEIQKSAEQLLDLGLIKYGGTRKNMAAMVVRSVGA